MKPAEYWQRRFEQLAQRQFDKADEYAKELRKEYDRAIRSVQRDIEVFYQRYSDNNGIVDLAEAKRQLNAKELKEFHWTLEEFMEKAKDNADGRWTQQLNNVYYRTRVSRFEALQMQINQQVEVLAGSKQQGTGELLGGAYTDTYYRTIFEIQLGTGIGASFAHVDQKGLETVLKAKLDGANWSERIWNDRAVLKQELYTKLSQAFIRGDSIDRTTQELAKRMNVSYSRAYRLVQTETAFFVEQATMNSYSESGVVDRYEYLAVLDNRTSDICRQMDGKIFKITEKEVGVNCPPLHCHCRSTTVPYFDDEEDVGERLARDPKTRETYTVPSDMTYDKWHKKHVVDKYGKDQAEIMRKKEVNAYSDQEQYARYKKILGKDAPKTFDDFQELKYTNGSEWKDIKDFYKGKTTNQLPDSMKFGIWKNNMAGVKWTAVDFAPGKLEKHSKHLAEYDGINLNDYREKATSLLNSSISGNIEGFVSESGYVFRYNRSTNDFATAKPSGVIETLFKPKKGENYWSEQIKKYRKE